MIPQNLSDDGPSGKHPSEASGQDLDEAVFAKPLRQCLNWQKYEAAFSSLVLVAEPATLGQLNSVLDPQNQSCIVEEHVNILTTLMLDDNHRSLF